MKELARRIATDYLSLADMARRAIREDHWALFKYENVRDFFEREINLSYRTVRRAISVLEACEELPSPDCRQAREAMASLGIRKAAIVAPAIRAEPAKWETWHDRAVKSRVEALQEAVNRALGRETAAAGDPNEVALRRLTQSLPEERQEWAERVIRAALKHYGGTSVAGIVLLALEALAQDLQAAGVEVKP